MITSSGHRLFKPKKERPTMNQRQRKLLVKLVEAQSEKKKDEVNAKYQFELEQIDKASRQDAGVTQTEQAINKIIKAVNKKLSACRDLDRTGASVYTTHQLNDKGEYTIHCYEKAQKWVDQELDHNNRRISLLDDIDDAKHATILAIELAGSEADIKTVLDGLDLSLDSDLNKAISVLL